MIRLPYISSTLYFTLLIFLPSFAWTLMPMWVTIRMRNFYLEILQIIIIFDLFRSIQANFDQSDDLNSYKLALKSLVLSLLSIYFLWANYFSFVGSLNLMWSVSRKCCSGGIFFLKGISSHAIPLKNTWFFSSSSDILFSGSFCSNLISTSLKSWLISPIKPFKTSSILVFSMLLCIYSFVSYWLFSNKFLANLSQNINTPMAHKSTFLPQWPYNASGAVYQRVPMKVEMGLFSDTIIFDSPQSVSFTCPQLVTKIFSGLSSRQMMPSECKISIPIIISATNILMMSSVNTHYFLFKQQQISPLGMYSITMQILHSFWKVSLMEANNVFSLIFLILSLCRTLNYFIFRLSIIFIAYWWLFYLSSASTTSPKVPRPRYLMDWQFSAPCLGVWMGPELGVEQPGEDSRILMDVYFLGSVGVGPGVRTFLGFCRGWVYLVYSLQHTTPIFTTLLDASICI